jgi:hypothetical protein
MDATNLPKGQSALKNGEGRPINLPGVYIHKGSNNKFTTANGRFGVAQADALMAPIWGGEWQRVSDVPTREELETARKAQELNDNREADVTSNKN